MFKNKAEREKFLREYKEWPDLGYGMTFQEVTLRFYRHVFKNRATVIVTECGETGKQETRYNLIIPDGDNYNPWDMHSGRTPSEFSGYNLQGVSVATIVDYLTKRRDEI